MSRARISQPRVFIALLALMAVLALAPARVTRWAEWFQAPTQFVIAPISHTFSFVSGVFRPARSRTLPDDPALADLQIERDVLQSELFRAEGRIADLERLVDELQQGLSAHRGSPIIPIEASVVGRSSDPSDGLLLVRAGSDRGVEKRETVAVVNGVQIVGRVVKVGPSISEVLPITHSPRGRKSEQDGGWIGGVIHVEGLDRSWSCQLRATRDGRLRGDVHQDAENIEVGQIVRLRDPNWPDSAQMLVLGRIERVGSKKDAPLRMEIDVVPDVDLARVRRVVLRVADEVDG